MTFTGFALPLIAAILVLILGIKEVVPRKLVTSRGTTTYRGNVWIGIAMIVVSTLILFGIAFRLGWYSIPGITR